MCSLILWCVLPRPAGLRKEVSVTLHELEVLEAVHLVVESPGLEDHLDLQMRLRFLR